MSVCRGNFSLLLYGYGCKKRLVSRFINQAVLSNEGAVVVAYALRKGVSSKRIIQKVAESVLPARQCSKYEPD
ncbi:MAG: hypothetical protein HC767_07085 [Akkermansiaceae bacterium]|nr:hypothetical protein [Akkermansiaceae bacterium]